MLGGFEPGEKNAPYPSETRLSAFDSLVNEHDSGRTL
jgi:hypothetical protein